MVLVAVYWFLGMKWRVNLSCGCLPSASSRRDIPLSIQSNVKSGKRCKPIHMAFGIRRTVVFTAKVCARACDYPGTSFRAGAARQY